MPRIRSSKGPVRPNEAQGNSKQTVRQGKEEKYHSLQSVRSGLVLHLNELNVLDNK